MATRNSYGASGKMILENEFYESASTHVDSSTTTELIAKDKETLVLETEKSSSNMYRPYKGGKNVEQYEINVDDLIKLIRQHGTKVE